MSVHLSRRSRSVVLGLAVSLSSLLSSGGLTTAAHASAGAPPAPGGVALTWTPTYMSNDHSYTQAEAEELARRFDLVAAMPIAFMDHAAAMRSVNPKLTLVAYQNATQASPQEVAGVPESYFAHDSSGARITAPSFGTYLMESSNPGWRTRTAQQCEDRSRKGNYDGCLVDMLTLGVFSKNFVTGLPVVPGTSTAYTQTQYRDQMTALAQHYRADNPELIHIGNSVENAYRYWQSPVSSRPLASSMPAVQMEDFLRGAGNAVTAYPTAADWVRNVDVVRDLESKGVSGLYTTKLWVGATDQQVAAWQSYAMATFLMGANGKSYFAFTRSRDKAGAIGANLPYRMPKQVGLPTGAMEKLSSGAYRRAYANGLSVVNPTTATVTVPLGGSHRTLSGQVVESLTLAPNSGDVLISMGDKTLPLGAYSAPTTAASGLPVTVGGSASDNVAVRAVSLAVRNEQTLQWLRKDGTWGAYQLLPATVATAGAASTSWSIALQLAPGRYGMSLVVEDSSGNLNATPRPWTTRTVS